MTPKRIPLNQFVNRYSQTKRNELEIAEAAYSKLDTKSEAYRLAEAFETAKRELFDYLESAGFEL